MYRVTVYEIDTGEMICWFSTPRKKDADAYKFRAECLHTRCVIEEV